MADEGKSAGETKDVEMQDAEKSKDDKEGKEGEKKEESKEQPIPKDLAD